MIKIKAWREYITIRAEGHAGFDVKGKDPVCAGASTLVMTFASIAENFQEEGLSWKPSDIRIDVNGCADIRIYPKKRYRDVCRAKMDVILEGLILLAKSYPDNVSLQIMDGTPDNASLYR